MKPNRSLIMRDAHRLYRQNIRLGMGLSFGQCLSWAWRKANERRAAIAQFQNAPRSTAGYRRAA